jgi:RNA polymerase sigma-70 factor (ECF subfamily)
MGTDPHAGGEPGGGSAALDGDGFARLFERHAPALWSLAAAILSDRSQADDVLQEACVIALQKLDSFRPGTHFQAWMGQVVRYVALNQQRKRAPVPMASLAQQGLDPDDQAEWRLAPTEALEGALAELVELHPDQHHFDDRVVAALRLLTPVARACLILRSVQKLEYSELAPMLGIPEGTAMSHVHRARTLLRNRLAPEGCARPDTGEMR